VIYGCLNKNECCQRRKARDALRGEKWGPLPAKRVIFAGSLRQTQLIVARANNFTLIGIVYIALDSHWQVHKFNKMDDWVQQQYLKAYCAKDGRLIAPVVDLDAFRDDLTSQRPNEVEAITSAVKM
jgi:hypothetical protein